MGRVFELLRSLNQTVEEFAKREEEYLRNFRNQRFAINRKLREGTEKTEARRTALLEDANSSFSAEQKRVRSRYETRRVRIQRARTAGIRNLPRRSQAAREKWMGDLQLRKFRAERKVTEELKGVSGRFAELSARLLEQQKTLGGLERRARRYFRGYRALLRMLQQAAPREEENQGANPTEPEELFHKLRCELDQPRDKSARSGSSCSRAPLAMCRPRF
jgi:hypothetical protein